LTELSGYISKLANINQAISEDFFPLDQEALNWKPHVNKWSVAQCLDHLIVTNGTYWPVFDLIISGSYRASFWARTNPFSNLFGKIMVKTLGPENRKKYKTFKTFKPSASKFPKGFPENLIQKNEELRTKFESLVKQNKTEIIIASPASSFVTYKIGHVIAMLVRHEERHILQAREVLHLYEKFLLNR